MQVERLTPAHLVPVCPAQREELPTDTLDATPFTAVWAEASPGFPGVNMDTSEAVP